VGLASSRKRRAFSVRTQVRSQAHDRCPLHDDRCAGQGCRREHRPTGGIRRYGEDALARIRFIKRAQDLGFTLDEVAALLRLERISACGPARKLAVKKLAVVDARLNDLVRLKAVLEELIARCDAGAARGCAIIESLSER